MKILVVALDDVYANILRSYFSYFRLDDEARYVGPPFSNISNYISWSDIVIVRQSLDNIVKMAETSSKKLIVTFTEDDKQENRANKSTTYISKPFRFTVLSETLDRISKECNKI